MSVIVTRGAGFIGSHVVDQLFERGHSPYVIDNLVSEARENIPVSVPLFEVDIRDQKRIAHIFDEIRPDGVCHQAAQISVSGSLRESIIDAENNVMGLLNLFHNAARVDANRVEFASRGVLYGEVAAPATEDFLKRRTSAHGISKWVGEQYLEFHARERGLQGVALRYSNVHGPRRNPHGEARVVAIFCKAMLMGKVATINGDRRYIRDSVFGANVAQANPAALETSLDTDLLACNVGTGFGRDVNDVPHKLMPEVRDHFRHKKRADPIPNCRHREARDGDLWSDFLSPDYAAKALKWSPTVKSANRLRQTVTWFAEQITE